MDETWAMRSSSLPIGAHQRRRNGLWREKETCCRTDNRRATNPRRSKPDCFARHRRARGLPPAVSHFARLIDAWASLWDASRGCQAGPLRRPSRRAIRYRWRAICYTRAPRHMRQCRLRSSGEEIEMTPRSAAFEALLGSTDGVVAERVGFEPTVPLQVQRFSRPPRSTTLAPLRTACARFRSFGRGG